MGQHLSYSQSDLIVRTKQILARLVSFDTTSEYSNREIIAYIQEYLSGFGVESQLIHDETGEKANLHALIGPSVDGGIGLSGHTDVVPVAGQTWSSDPFTLVERDGRLVGRGTCDMKGFLACVMALVPRFVALRLQRPIHLLFSYDEEVGCTGVRSMISQMGRDFPMPGAVIVGEPTRLGVVDAHKGPGRWIIEITGRAAHSSMPALGVNAIAYGGLVLEELARIARDLEAGPTNQRCDPPTNSLQVTTIEGGSASNIVPARCQIGFGVRGLPGFNMDEIEHKVRTFVEETCLRDMRARAPEADVVIELVNYVPPFEAAKDSRAVLLALSTLGSNETGAVSYTTEAGLFEDAGASAVVCGPGDIAQAHTADEWVETSQLVACLDFLQKLSAHVRA